MREFKEFMLDVLHDKRKKAILSLFLWFLFFVLIFLLIGGRNAIPKEYRSQTQSNKNIITSSPIDNYKNMESFEFSYLIEITESNITDTYKIDGTYYNNKYYFELLNNKYIIDNNTIYLVDDQNKQLKQIKDINPKSLFNRLDLRILMKDSIHTFISSSTEKDTTLYKDGTKTINYQYKNYENKTIDLTISIKENMINSIVMNFKDYFNNQYQQFKVSVSYQHINDIKEYNKNYDGYELFREGE